MVGKELTKRGVVVISIRVKSKNKSSAYHHVSTAVLAADVVETYTNEFGVRDSVINACQNAELMPPGNVRPIELEFGKYEVEIIACREVQ
jgi:hypothetical protein